MIQLIFNMKGKRTYLAHLYPTDFFGNVFDFIVHETDVIFDRFGEFAAREKVLVLNSEKTKHESNISHMIILSRQIQ